MELFGHRPAHACLKWVCNASPWQITEREGGDASHRLLSYENTLTFSTEISSQGGNPALEFLDSLFSIGLRLLIVMTTAINKSDWIYLSVPKNHAESWRMRPRSLSTDNATKWLIRLTFSVRTSSLCCEGAEVQMTLWLLCKQKCLQNPFCLWKLSVTFGLKVMDFSLASSDLLAWVAVLHLCLQ